ncbi:MAG TPA: hypothetical protein VJ768_05420 [Anaerolineales bacterium]|nr:hypothetical protein [Anaerolineales bacterium]
MAHMTVAVSEGAFRKSFEVLVKNVAWEKEDSSDFGAFSAGYHIKGHLEGGSIDLRSDNTVEVKELDIRWDKLEVTLGLDIPEICVGGGCIPMPWPIPDICLPRICVFSDDPDISISPDFAALVAHEVSFAGGVDVRYFDASLPVPPGFNPCALLQDVLVDADIIDPFPDHNQWHLFLNPEFIDLDPFDFPDIVGDLIEDALTSAIEALIPGGWVRDVILAIIGGIADLIRFILDIPDEIDEWLSDLFNVSFGLFDFLVTLVLDFFGHCVPIYRIDDPFEIMPAKTSTNLLLSGAPVTLVPVKVPIQRLSALVTDVELVVEADLGG